MIRPMGDLAFDNTFVRDLPADPVSDNVPRQVSGASYTRVAPTPVRSPRLLAWSKDLGERLSIRPDAPIVEALAGNRVLPGMQPYAARYGGHQFGHWAGQLGDGRAITLGEVLARDGSRQELQLKGAGKTPYSRTADGRAVLRSSLREFACSEAVHRLGVPTTRALSLVATGEDVIRDMFYDGNPAPEPGAVVCRVAPSFLRFGNFQIHAARNEPELLKRLVDYTIKNFFHELSYEEFFREVCARTARLMVDWMRLGFVHGVMNTDNMSILGLTIDYGPYGWLEGFDTQWTPNTTDAPTLRYTYGNQAGIAHWNLARLAESLVSLMDVKQLESGLELYATTFQEGWNRALAAKLGLKAVDDELGSGLFRALAAAETDFTLFFRNLAVENPTMDSLKSSFYTERPVDDPLVPWLAQYQEKLKEETVGPRERVVQMKQANPKYVFRNYLAVQAIEAMEQGDASVLERTMRVLERPYDDQPENEDLAARRPDWARDRAGCSALSCSS
jgi:serine/tyrosine/threonine adenylyltransferase